MLENAVKNRVCDASEDPSDVELEKRLVSEEIDEILLAYRKRRQDQLPLLYKVNDLLEHSPLI